MSNILKAFIQHNKQLSKQCFNSAANGKNRANNMGAGLEVVSQEIFAGTI